MLKVFLSLSVLFSSVSALAFPTHQFYCNINSVNPKVGFKFEIEDHAVKSGLGTVTLYREIAHSRKNQSGPMWEVFQRAQVRASIAWGRGSHGEPAMTGVNIDMGKSGRIKAAVTAPYAGYSNVSPGIIVADALGFSFPQGIKTDTCSAFLATGVKPIMTGSN